MNVLNNIFNKMCKEGNFNSRSFLSWADKNMLLSHNGGRMTKVTRINKSNSTSRVVCLKMIEDENDDGFMNLDESSQEDLPFD